MYVCGPTTYNFIHLGNARPLVVFDTIRRYLKYRGYVVTYVQNFTDVDDKIINRAREEGIDAAALAQRYIDEYFIDADALGVVRADLHPRVSQHMPEIIEMVSKLVEKGHAYQLDGDVYFRVGSFPTYGKLSGRSLEEMLMGARVEINDRKEQPVDFALWKKAKPGEPSWDSPWGKGRPGWHIECSAMSMKYLGASFDIHGGGADLTFPHHENEVAQSEAYSGQPFVRYWLHNGFITVNKEKMSKSLGNFFIVRDILDKFSAQVVRFYLLSTHYRSPLDFDDSKLQEAGRALDRIKTTWLLLKEAVGKADHEAELSDRDIIDKLSLLQSEFVLAMDDDFNTSLAISHIFEMAHEINKYLAGENITDRVIELATGLLAETTNVLGLDLKTKNHDRGLIGELTQVLIGIRNEARKGKDFATSDIIRDLLGGQGIMLEDSKEGTRFRFQDEPNLDDIMEGVTELRRVLREKRNFVLADLLRDSLGRAGIVLEDTKEGTRWKVKD